MKLAVIGCIPDNIPGVLQTCDYALFWLNKKGLFLYPEKCGLSGPSNNVVEVLAYLSRIKNYTDKNGKPEIHAAGKAFLRSFRKGDFGKIMLED